MCMFGVYLGLSGFLWGLGEGFVSPPTQNNLRTNFSLHVLQQAQSSNHDNSDESEKRSHLEDDISRRLSLSKDKAISALSRTTESEKKVGQNDKTQNKNSRTKPASSRTKRGRRLTAMRRSSKAKTRVSSSLLPPPPTEPESTLKSRQNQNRRSSRPKPFSSLLPPPLDNLKSSNYKDDDNKGKDDDFSSGLSSWEEFLGRADGGSSSSTDDSDRLLPKQSAANKRPTAPAEIRDTKTVASRLPSIRDLFPPELSSSNVTSLSASTSTKSTNGASRSESRSESLDGVLPVSELFYRSSQSISTEDDDDDDDDDDSEVYGSKSGKKKKCKQEEGDDEELPFSAEQTDQLTTNGNKVKIRRNRANNASSTATKAAPKRKKGQANSTSSKAKRARGRKMVRRGMEMLVGGTPVNADPPMRSVELFYKMQKDTLASELDWSSMISTNTPDFGPLLHSSSVESVSKRELGLFCEYFVSATMKWDVCPKDLRVMAKDFKTSQQAVESAFVAEMEDEMAALNGGNDSFSIADCIETADEEQTVLASPRDKYNILQSVKDDSGGNILSLLRNTDGNAVEDESGQPSSRLSKENKSATQTVNTYSSPKGFGQKKMKRLNHEKAGSKNKDTEQQQRWRMMGILLKFNIDVEKAELESALVGSACSALRSVLARGVVSVLKSKLAGLTVNISKLKLTEIDDGSTDVHVEFTLEGKGDYADLDIDKRTARIDAALGQAMDDGDLVLALAAAARDETGWPTEIRDRVVEEILFEDDDGDGPLEEVSPSDLDKQPRKNKEKKKESDVVPPTQEHKLGELISAGDHDGLFFDYSEANSHRAPFKGELGPLLVDAATARAVQRHPRVIAIGDVHGCIDELQDLLRLCEYQPGDQVVFLGDLVSKGPDSISVVQMAREIGAIGVRGNHDFEVIRWHQAIKSGVEPPVVGSEHYHIASCLAKADMKWMHSLPWYISSRELGALFVHAGFVSGIKLAKQNPRLMMNMRSILPDGTVTSKFFNNWPWARLWDGPQTVLFGHDADRGLQQYEHAIGLDTGCVYGGRLTACILPEKRLVSVSARRGYFKYRRKHYD